VKRQANAACALQPHRKLSDHVCYGESTDKAVMGILPPHFQRHGDCFELPVWQCSLKFFQVSIKPGKQLVGKRTLDKREAYASDIKERVKERPGGYQC